MAKSIDRIVDQTDCSHTYLRSIGTREHNGEEVSTYVCYHPELAFCGKKHYGNAIAAREEVRIQGLLFYRRTEQPKQVS